MRLRGVNLMLAVVLVSCGPGPSSVVPGAAPSYPTPLVNQRRAGYENETIPASPTVAWDVDAGTGMRGTVVVVGPAVIAATTNRQLIAFNADNGVRHWDQRFGATVSSTPVYDRGKVYVGTTQYEGTLFSMDITRGRRVWKNEIGPVRFSPLIGSSAIYVGTDGGTVAALTPESGAALWRAGLRSSIAESLIDAGDHIIAIALNDSVFSLNKSSGSLTARGTLPGTPSAPAALHGSTLIIPLQSGAIVGINAVTLTNQWQVQADAPVLTPPAVSNGVAYIASRAGTLYRIVDGKLEEVGKLGHSISASMTLTRDHLLLGSYDGTLLAVTRNGEIAWKHKFDDSIVAPVAVDKQSIYVPLLRGRLVKLR